MSHDASPSLFILQKVRLEGGAAGTAAVQETKGDGGGSKAGSEDEDGDGEGADGQEGTD